MIGIIGAMKVEVEEILAKMTDIQTRTISGIPYQTGRLSGVDCVVARCGVGKVAAAVCAQTLIMEFSPTAVLNVGVAGGIGSSIHIGDLVVSTSLIQHDMNTSALGDPKGFISGLERIKIPASPVLGKLAMEAAESVFGKEKVHTGTIATGDQFICDAQTLHRIAEEFDACACEMEGGSIAQVCYMNGVDFTVLRSISDNADEQASVDFTQFAEESAHKTSVMIAALLPKIAFAT